MLRNKRLFVVLILILGLLGSGCARKDTGEKAEQVDKGTVTVSDGKENDVTQKDNTSDDEDGGGNEFNNPSEVSIAKVEVLVSEDTYYYMNAPLGLDELIDKSDQLKGEKIFFISDNNATHKAYQSLINKLIELEIEYVECDN